MLIEFYKIQATGNDFIVTDFDKIPPSIFDPETIKRICDRHFGIGADGFIAVEKSKDFAFKFHYYNSDGSRGEMCANGCRAAINFSRDHNWIESKSEFNFLADDGEHFGFYYSEDEIQLDLLVNSNIREIDSDLYHLPSWIKRGYFINTGVPHVVLICEDLPDQEQIEKYGEFIRFHDSFAPKGTNVNFMEIFSDNSIFVRTFERGVEKETLSCGTGVTASALVAEKIKKKPLDKIKVLTKGGELYILSRNERINILGPAKIVFKGNLQINSEHIELKCLN